MTTGDQVVVVARSWIGTRFQHQGRVRGVGVDCVGLLIGIAHELALSAFDTTGYARRPDGRMLKDTCDREMTPIARSAVELGDIGLFALTGDPQHLAVFGDYPGGLSIIHAHAPNRRVVENRFDDMWAGRLVAAYRLPGVA